MIAENIATLRKRENLSQEKLAEAIGVSRQTIAKWEAGESVPDVLHSAQLADFFDVSLDELVHLESHLLTAPNGKGKYIFGTVTVGQRGEIHLPPRARNVFHIQAGDQLLLLGDENQGLALLDPSFFLEAPKHFSEKQQVAE
ncbi:helix-turn-helix domain-containing protein [Streptococcus panodentis]|uniref:XRE family transcriptional regulator n=1 Tax=Streptococcus panodentis TaxID=1581472 RepID=A0ABS5AT61_9STRE|nr:MULTISPECIES: helix-turn-helix domain-containing protein [Streptococcus]KXT79764.1 Transcriptional regulator [Streptococcus sp. DD11]MBP2619764.1 XRE family transcriptional regulator [Streptococcus panodentis]